MSAVFVDKEDKFDPILDYEGKNLVLQKIGKKYAKKLHYLIKNDKVTQYLIIKPVDTLKSMKQRIKLSNYRWDSQFEFKYTILLKTNSSLFIDVKKNLLPQNKHLITDEGIVCGTIVLWNINRRHRCAELGIWLGVDFWHTGINYEACELILKIAFNHLKLHRIEAKIVPKNIRSIKMFERLGFKREGLLREKVVKNSSFCDLLVYSMLEKEFQ